MESSSQDDGHKEGRGSRKRPPPQMKFMFIDSTTQGTNSRPNKAVRSFVMHRARRSKPWSTRQKQLQSPDAESGAEGQPSPSQPHGRAGEPLSVGSSRAFGSPVSSDGSTGTNSRAGSQPCVTPPSSHGSACDVPGCNGESCRHTALARRDGFALRALDPFDCLAVQMDAKTSTLLNHFVRNLSPRLIPVDLHQSSNIATTQWVANSLRNTTSAPFAYALLTGAAYHLLAIGTGEVEDALYYKAKAISEINTLLSDAKTSIDDSNIAAVFILLCLEESALAPGGKSDDDANRSELQRSIHLNGLRTMIQQRGGLSALGSNRCLQVFILMHSIAHSISTFQRPYTTLLDGTGQPQKYDIPSFRSRPASARVLRLFRDLKLDPELFDIVSNIVVYTGDLSAWYDDRKSPLDPLELQKHACLLNYRLFDWYMKPAERKGKGAHSAERNPVGLSICLALVIFMVKISQPHDPSHRAMVLTAVRKLRAALTMGSIFRWAKSPDLLLWTLTMGALAAQGSSEAPFFNQYCSVAFADAGFDERSNAEELLGRMRKGLWIPMLLDEEVKRLWVHMGLVKGGEGADVGEEALVSPEIKEDDVVGLLTSTRFFS